MKNIVKKMVCGVTASLLCLVFPVTAQGNAKEEPSTPITEFSIIARTPEAHGEYAYFGGYVKREGSSAAVYIDTASYVLDSKENAVWIDEEFFESETFWKWYFLDYGKAYNDEVDWEEVEKRKQPENFNGQNIGFNGYVDMKDRGPGGAYAATLKGKPLETEEMKTEEKTTAVPAGGTTEQEAIQVSYYRLMASPQAYKGKWVQVDGAWQYRGEIKGTEEIDGKSVSVVIKDFANLEALCNTKSGGMDIEMLVDALGMPSILTDYQGSYIQDFDTMKYSLLKVPVFVTGRIDIESRDILHSKYIHFSEVTRITLHNNFIKNNKWLQGIEGVE